MTVRAVVYSDDNSLRRYVVASLGSTTRLAFVESYPALLASMVIGGVDLVILDGDATPAGSVDVARHLKDHFEACPPILLIVARAADAWLALMSKADATVGLGRQPQALAATVSRLMTRSGPRPAASRCRP
ncbi:response regulator [Mycobacterium gordonae]|uniref:response regulator n=1 Tax=Mycobacterium gordonae TaxID=1778 RepID=UPI002108E9BF|nr:response regulator [Mycobacterium gordonae]MCQ4362356.1 response regulator [Mycobacterium gordonae]